MKTILITGGSRGLGLEITKQQLSTGNKIIVISRSETEEIQKLIREAPEKISFLSFDLRDPQETENFINGKIGLDTPIHALVNNAAAPYEALVSNINPSETKRLFDLNVLTPMVLTKFAIKNMLLHQTQGSIVHLSSVCVHTGYSGLSAYAASKGALEAFSKNVAREWGGRGIRSNCVVAGFMETAMTQNLPLEIKTRIFRRSALKSPTEPRSVAATVNFLLSDASHSLTGQNVFVDSGVI